MVAVDKEVVVNASVERVFSYISEPGNLPEIWPSLMEIKAVQSLPIGGYRFRWAYEMRFRGTGEYTEMVPNQWFVIETKGGIKSKITWTCRLKEDKTRVTFTIEYTVPIPLLGKIAEAIIVKMNDQEGDVMMANLGARFILSIH